ncbi:MAG: ABC transporter permease [Lachnospiraceae bacterium]|nr:ABC transporter permease [Lachnospiraceae bacterium]
MNKTVNKKGIRDRLPSLILMLLLLAAWQTAAVIIDKNNILPAPTAIIRKIWELKETLFLKHLPETLLTVLSGWGLAIVIGVLLAVLMHFSLILEAMLHPVLLVTQTIPVMCISPLFVIWLGYTMGARLIAVVLSTFFAITLNTYQGLQSVDQRKKEWLLTCGAGRFSVFWHLEVPTALPAFMTALKMTIPWAVVDAAVAEWLGATQGLGYFSKRMITKMDGAGVFAPLVLLCILALLGMWILNVIDRKCITWRSEN